MLCVSEIWAHTCRTRYYILVSQNITVSQLEHSVKPSQLLFQGYNTFLQLTNNDERCDHIRRPTVFSLMTTKFKYRYYDLKHCKQIPKRYN